MNYREPYLELTCTDCGCLYTPDQGDCPACRSANVSYDAGMAREYAEDMREQERLESEGWRRA